MMLDEMILSVAKQPKASAARGQIVRYSGDVCNLPRTLVVTRSDDRDIYVADLADVDYGIHQLNHCYFSGGPGCRFELTDKFSHADIVAHESAVAASMEQKRIERDAKIAESARLVSVGNELAARVVPVGTKAAIIAEEIVDDCDSQSDYYGHKTGRRVILAWSKHGRDLFTEMRKAAAKFEPTAHLATANDDAEHREKYSMGGGFYLKTGFRHSSGWRVSKQKFYNGVAQDIAVALAKGESVA